MDESALEDACNRWCEMVTALTTRAPRDMREAAEMLSIALDAWELVGLEDEESVYVEPVRVIRQVRDAMKLWAAGVAPLPA